MSILQYQAKKIYNDDFYNKLFNKIDELFIFTDDGKIKQSEFYKELSKNGIDGKCGKIKIKINDYLISNGVEKTKKQRGYIFFRNIKKFN